MLRTTDLMWDRTLARPLIVDESLHVFVSERTAWHTALDGSMHRRMGQVTWTACRMRMCIWVVIPDDQSSPIRLLPPEGYRSRTGRAQLTEAFHHYIWMNWLRLAHAEGTKIAMHRCTLRLESILQVWSGSTPRSQKGECGHGNGEAVGLSTSPPSQKLDYPDIYVISSIWKES